MIPTTTAAMDQHAPVPFKQGANERAMTVYAIFLCSLIVISVFVERLRGLRHDKAKWWCRVLQDVFRTLDRKTSWQWLGRPSIGLTVLSGIYVAANVFLCVRMLAATYINHYASRCGWLGAANMALCVFFSMKNTPLSFLPTSHAELNVLHRIVGYTSGILILMHALLYTITLAMRDHLAKLLEWSDLSGIGSGTSMVVLIVIGIYRTRNFRLFYFSHIMGFCAMLAFTYFHRPNWFKKLPIVVLFMASLWIFDRGVRGARTVYHMVNNQVTLHPLPDGATRVIVHKPANGATITAGTHCYLWIPRLRFLQTHPFTVVSSGPAGIELVIKAQEGFTQKILALAQAKPGIAIPWVSVDGPYGSLPDTRKYDRIIFVAGGSGAAFTFGLMNRTMNLADQRPGQIIELVWAVKRSEDLTWFHEHLQNHMMIGSHINVNLFVTRERVEPWQDHELGTIVREAELEEASDSSSDIVVSETTSLLVGKETSLQATYIRDLLSGSIYWSQVKREKLNVSVVIQNAVGAVGAHQRVLVAMCGPASLTDAVRNTVEDLRDLTGFQCDFHEEQF